MTSTTPWTSPPTAWPGPPELRRARARQRAVRLWVRRWRRWLAAAALALATLSALRVLTPPPPPTKPVWVAARDLPVGAVLAADALRVVAWPAEAVPDGALTPPDAAGRTLASPVRAGEALTDARLLGPGLLAGRPAGLVAATVRVADPAAASLVRPGDRIDLLSPTGSVPAASAVLVLAVPGAGGDEGGGLLGGGGAEPGEAGMLVVGVRPEVAQRLAAATAPDALGSAQGLLLTVRPPADHAPDIREP